MNAIASTFSHRTPMVRADAGHWLEPDQLQRVIPSIFAEGAHGSRSERYAQIPTSRVLEGLRDEGFFPVFACQQRNRDPSKRGYAKHMVRLQRITDIEAAREFSFIGGMESRIETVPEIILLNSHDGSSSYQLISGAFRFVCCNGMVTGDVTSDIRVRHQGDVVGDVIDGVHEVARTTMEAEERRDSMRSLVLPNFAQRAFAQAALVARYGDPDQGAHIPVEPEQVLMPRRPQDDDPSLWATFNRVQESLTKGGIRGRSKRGRRSQTRAVNGIDGDVKLNRALWALAKSLQEQMETA